MGKGETDINIKDKKFLRFFSLDGDIDFAEELIEVKIYIDDKEEPDHYLRAEKFVMPQSVRKTFDVPVTGNKARIEIEIFSKYDISNLKVKPI